MSASTHHLCSMFRRITPLFLAALVLLSFLGAGMFPDRILTILVGGLVVFGLVFAWFIPEPKRSWPFWAFWLTGVLFYLSAVVLFLFFEHEFSKNLLAAVAAVGALFYIGHLRLYLFEPSRYRPYSVERMSSVIYLLTAFFAAASGFGFILLVQAPLWALTPVMFLLYFFLCSGTLWVSKIEMPTRAVFSIIGGLVLMELFVVVSFLPSGYITNAAIVTLAFYVFLGLTRALFQGRLTKSVVLRYLGFSILLLLGILLTAQWI